jgi:prevent-host-death family protein
MVTAFFLRSVGSTHAQCRVFICEGFSDPVGLESRWWRPIRADTSLLHRHNSCVYNCCGMNDSRDVPATELRANLAAFLDEARSGGEFRITRGSRVAARLVPPVLEERSVTALEDQ